MTDLTRLKVIVGAVLGTTLPTRQAIREEIARARASCPDVSDEQAEELARYFETVHGVTMKDGATLKQPGLEPWLDDRRSEIDPYYWDRYNSLLVRKDFPRQVLSILDRVTDRILGLLEDPDKEGKWDRRGMVMGHVQSGKTANYTGLICKAADAGYKIIVVIAGIHNNLRNQTQRRIDEGFIGWDSTRRLEGSIHTMTVVGVGRFDSQRRPNSFTTPQQDFNKQIADAISVPLRNLREPVVFVIKKNPSTLSNLIEWLTVQNAQYGATTVPEPMLLIDDEADNASINISYNQDEVSKINGQIRQLLALFDRNCYIGYTATPFANIFIDPQSKDEMLGDDLFPRDFVVSLDPPDNYFGPNRVFSAGSSKFLQPIEDHSDLLPLSHRIDHHVPARPVSLDTAVRVFVLARAIRLVRGHTRSHNSMLVNVSRFVNVQSQIRNHIYQLINKIQASCRVNAALPSYDALRDVEIAALRSAFRDHYEDSCGVAWSAVQANLHQSASPINVIAVNSRSPESLDYLEHHRTGFNVIAIGGLSLSRGLTLEGLVISYFLRNSMMYDTLLQMGRWFGYRDRYEDLCRIWMTEEAQGWYGHIAESIEELRKDVTQMQAANATPKEFGLRVRSHPDRLIVTARNKIGSGQHQRVRIGLANCFIETAILRRDEPSIRANLTAGISMAQRLRDCGCPPEKGKPVNGGRLISSVSVTIVDRFLAAFRNCPGSAMTDTEPVRSYISDRSADELSKWDVLFVGVSDRNQRTGKPLIYSDLGFTLVCQRRIEGRRSDEKILMITNKQRVASRGLEKVGLKLHQVRAAEIEYDSDNPSPTGRRRNYPDWIYRRVRKKPLLAIHILAIGKKDEDLSSSQPVLAWSISFPSTQHPEQRVEYVVNTTWYKERYQDEDGVSGG